MSRKQDSLTLLPAPVADVRPYVIGLTGAFGSGCSSAAHYLSQQPEPYLAVRLSAYLRALWEEERGTFPTREDLQNLGDRLRHDGGPHAVVEQAIEAKLADAKGPVTRIAIDAIRNVGEVRWLQERYGERFTLFALYADKSVRYERYRKEYASEAEFSRDDQRDRGETAEDWGQQVARCVDAADIFLINNDQVDEYRLDTVLGDKIAKYCAIAEGRGTDFADPCEMLMNLAYSASHGSRCLKRQVGAVIARGAEPLSTGFNENPDRMKPCVDEFDGTCFRDRIRQNKYNELVDQSARCPHCGREFRDVLLPPWTCPQCRHKLDDYFFPDRAMWWCTALHAEHRAIINAGERQMHDCDIYTTTFPCPQCAQQIIHAGLKRVIYVDAYPDVGGQQLLDRAGVELELFEGVRSRNFHRFFSGVQAQKEADAVEKISEKAKRRGR
jgi:deoxycytidylate deaminase/dephospho-CoA kinase